jgi:hypothetical protein
METITGKFGSFLKWYGKEFEKHNDEHVKAMLVRVAVEYERIIQRKFREAKHGVAYVVGGKLHVASKPGEAPAIWTGRLSQGITHVIQKNHLGFWTVRVGPTVAAYPAYLEEGTRHMGARPVWKPALKELNINRRF